MIDIEKKLLGNNLSNLGRSADMLWLSIGKPLVIELKQNKEKREATEYAIHFQCQWRFVKDGKILLASHDIYNLYNNSLQYDDSWDWDVFGREKEQSSIFDVRSSEFKDEFIPLRIENIYFAETSDLHIDLDYGVRFDTFITCSARQEYYRLLDHHTNEHYVVYE